MHKYCGHEVIRALKRLWEVSSSGQDVESFYLFVLLSKRKTQHKIGIVELVSLFSAMLYQVVRVTETICTLNVLCTLQEAV
jgi:hypothetical protein